MFKFKGRKNSISSIALIVFLSALIFVFWQKPVSAQTLIKVGGGIAEAISGIIGWAVYYLLLAVGKLTTLIIDLLVNVAQFNNFIDSPTVTRGWVVMRDLCNMFFIIILLLIAFGTVLGIETWNHKRLLGRLILAAVLINFSKMICGVLIDFSQVIMMIFVNAFKDMAAGNIVNAIGLDMVLSLEGSASESGFAAAGGITVAVILAAVFTMISFVTVLAIFLILLVRIVMLWFLVVFSPIIWIGNLVPITAKYVSDWWGQFIKWIIIGPVLAFFLWLTLMVTSPGETPSGYYYKKSVEGTSVKTEGSYTLNALTETNNALSYAFGIAMLLMSLGFATQLGGRAASVIVSRSKKIGAGFTRLIGATTGATWAGRAVRDYGVGTIRARRDKTLEKFPALKAFTKEGQEETKIMRDAITKEKVGFKGAKEAGRETIRLKKEKKLDEAGWLSSPGQRAKALQEYEQGSFEYEAILSRMAKEGDFAGKGGDIEKKAGYNRVFANTLHTKSKKHDWAAGEARWGQDKETGEWKMRDISKAIQGKVRGMRVHEMESTFIKSAEGAKSNIYGEVGDDAVVNKILGIEDKEKFDKLAGTTKENILKAIASSLVNEKQFNLDTKQKKALEDQYVKLSGGKSMDDLNKLKKEQDLEQKEGIDKRRRELKEAKEKKKGKKAPSEIKNEITKLENQIKDLRGRAKKEAKELGPLGKKLFIEKAEELKRQKNLLEKQYNL